MINPIQNNLDKIIEACQKHKVSSLYLFGSGARENDFTEKSDLDFLVNFIPTLSNSDEEIFQRVANKESLGNAIESITKRKVDFIQEEFIKNRYLLYFINKEKKILYGVS